MFKKRYFIRFFLWLVVFILLLPVLLFFAFQIKPVQIFLNDKITELVSDKLNTKVTIEYISYEAPFDIILKKIYIEDYQKDTLFYVNELKVRPTYYSFRKKHLTIDKINLNNLRVEYRIDSTGYSNFDFFIANLPQSSTEIDENDASKITIKSLELNNSSVFYSTQENDTIPYQFDIDTFDIQNISLEIDDLYFQEDSISLRLEEFNFIEKSGFELQNLSSDILFTDNSFFISNTRLQLNESIVFFEKAGINYSSLEEIEETPENLFTEIIIHEKSVFSFSDLGYFSPLFKNYNEKITFGCDISGNLGHLTANKILVRYKKDTYALVKFEIFGLPNIENTFFDIQFEDFRTNIAELTPIENPLDNFSNIIVLPEDVRIPAMIEFQGGIVGNISDFYFLGNLITSVGIFSSDMNIKLDSNKSELVGNFGLQNFDIGYVLKNEMLGEISLLDTINFTMIDSNTFRGFNNLYISKLSFNNYVYSNIISDVYFLNDSISAKIDVLDSNLNANLDVRVRLSGIDTRTKFNFLINSANLFPLNFIEDDVTASFTLGVEGDFTGNNIDDIEGNIKFSEPLNLVKNMERHIINEFSIIAENTTKIGDNTLKIINIESDILSANLQGTFDFEDLALFGSNIASYYFPALSNDSIVDLFSSKKNIGNNLRFNLIVNNFTPIVSIFKLKFSLSENTQISGSIQSEKQEFSVKIKADSLLLSTNRISDLVIDIQGDTNSILTSVMCDSIQISEFSFQNFKISMKGENDTANLKISWKNNSDLLNFGNIRTDLILNNDTSGNLQTKFIIPKDTIAINDKLWTLYSDSIYIDTTGIDISKITMSSFLKDGNNIKQYIGIKGKISKDISDTLNFTLQKFDISQLNPILHNVVLEGYMNTDFVATRLLDTPMIAMMSVIDRFEINDVGLGQVIQSLEWIDKNKSLHNEITIQKVSKSVENINGKDTIIVSFFRSLFVEGDYFIESQRFDFDVIIENMKLKPFAPYLDDFVEFSRRSRLTGKLKIKGDLVYQDITGEINFFGPFFIPKTGVSYTINEGMKIKFEKNKIIIDSTVLVGPKLVGDALLYGNIAHQDFNAPYVDIYFRADTIAFLDIPRTNENNYYGKVVASGNIGIKGYPENLHITADIATEKNTNFTLLLDRPNDVSNETSIVSFVTIQDTITLKDEQEESNTNIDFDLNLTLNPDAKFKIVFDEFTGEALEIQGEGKVKIKKTVLEEIVLFGKISIVYGVYTFVLQNIINRKFEIKKGSSIIFNGVPTDGIIDISTVYSIKNVKLYNLLMDENYAEQKTQADCYLKLTGEILNPEIHFSVELPKADQRIASQVENLDDANKNKQFLSLLIFGRFQPLPGLTYDPNANIASDAFNTGELISNQLNSLLSNINSDVELDVNYVTGNQQTTDQFDVAVSVPLFNERLSINTDVGVGGNNANADDQNNFIGDFEVDYIVNKKGNIRLRAFNKTNRNEFYDRGPYTQGVGILYKNDFDNIFRKDTMKNVLIDTIK